MSKMKLSDAFMETVVEGTKSRVDKAKKRGMDPAQLQAINAFSSKIQSMINESRDNNNNNNTTTKAKDKEEEELIKKTKVDEEHLSLIVARVMKHRSDTPKIVEQIVKLNTSTSSTSTSSSPSTTTTNTSNTNNNNNNTSSDETQVNNIMQEIGDMFAYYTHTITTAKEELPQHLDKANRLLSTIQMMKSINPSSSSSSSSPASSTSPSTSSSTTATTSPNTATATATTSQQSSSSSSSKPAAKTTAPSPTETKPPVTDAKNLPSKIPKRVASAAAKDAAKEPEAAPTPTKANGKRKSMNSTNPEAETMPRRSPRHKTGAS